MQNIYDEVDAALASIDGVIAANNQDFDDAMVVSDILTRNSTVGITLEDGKTLRRLGIKVDLEPLGLGRTHVGTEASALTQTGKDGLFGIAIGAIVVLIAFIIHKLFKWFKGTSSSKSGSGSLSKSEAEKKFPTMGSSGSATAIKVPKLLGHQDDVNDFFSKFNEFYNSVSDDLDDIADTKEGVKEEDFIKATIGKLVATLKPIGYSIHGTTFDDIKKEIGDLDSAKLDFLKIGIVDIEIHAPKLILDKNAEKDAGELEDDLNKLIKDGEVTDKAVLRVTKDYASCIVAVLRKTFTQSLSITGKHNIFLDAKQTLVDRAYAATAIESVKKHDDLRPFMINVPIENHNKLAAAYDKAISANKGTGFGPITAHIQLKELVAKYETDIAALAKGEKPPAAKDKK